MAILDIFTGGVATHAAQAKKISQGKDTDTQINKLQTRDKGHDKVDEQLAKVTQTHHDENTDSQLDKTVTDIKNVIESQKESTTEQKKETNTIFTQLRETLLDVTLAGKSEIPVGARATANMGTVDTPQAIPADKRNTGVTGVKGDISPQSRTNTSEADTQKEAVNRLTDPAQKNGNLPPAVQASLATLPAVQENTNDTLKSLLDGDRPSPGPNVDQDLPGSAPRKVKEDILEVKITNFDDMADAFKKLGLIGGAALEDKKKSPNVKEPGGAKGLGMLVGMLWGGIKKLGKFIAFLGSKIWGFVKGLAGKLWSFAKNIGGKLWNFAKGAIGKLWDFAKTAGSRLWDIAKSVGSKIGDLAKSAWSTIKNVGGTVIKSATNLAKNAASKISSLASGAAETLKSVGSSILNKAKDIGKTAVDSIKSAGSSIWGSIKSGFSKLTGGGATAAKGATKAATTAAASTKPTKAKGFLSKAWSWGTSKVKSAGSAIKSGVKKGVSAVGGAASKAWTGAKSVAKKGLTMVKKVASKVNPMQLIAKAKGAFKGSLGKILKTVVKVPVIGTLLEGVFATMKVKDIMANKEMSPKDKQEAVGRVVMRSIGGTLGGVIAASLAQLANVAPGLGLVIGPLAYLGGDWLGRKAADWIGGFDGVDEKMGEVTGNVFGLDYAEGAKAKEPEVKPAETKVDVPKPEGDTKSDLGEALKGESGTGAGAVGAVGAAGSTGTVGSPGGADITGAPPPAIKPGAQLNKESRTGLIAGGKKALKTGKASATTALGKVKPMVTAVKKKGSGLWGKTKTKATAVWDKMKKTGGAAWDRLQEMGGGSVGKAWTRIKAMGGNAYDKVKQLGGDAWDKMKESGIGKAAGAGAGKLKQVTGKLRDGAMALPAAARSGISKLGPVPKGHPGKISREDVFAAGGGVKSVKDMSPEERERYVAKEKERKSNMQARIKERDKTYANNLESSKSPSGVKSKLAGAAQSTGGFLKKGAAAAGGVASKAMSKVGDGIQKLKELQEEKNRKEDDAKGQQQSTNNISSSSSSTNTNTTVNKFDTDAVSKWRSNFIEKQHNPGNYSR